MLPEFIALTRFPAPDRAATSEAAIALCKAWWNIRFVPQHCWHDFAANNVTNSAAALTPKQRTDAVTVARAVARVVRTSPFAVKCLPQAVAARQMLLRRAIASTLYIGAAKKGRPGDRFHAWLKIGDSFITGACDEGATPSSPTEHFAVSQITELARARRLCEGCT